MHDRRGKASPHHNNDNNSLGNGKEDAAAIDYCRTDYNSFVG
jgi:hypothetical protein